MTVQRRVFVLAVYVGASATLGCSGVQAIDKVPEGTEVTIVTHDGSVVRGKLRSVEAEKVVVAGDRPESRTAIERMTIAQVSTNRAASPKPNVRELVVPANTSFSAALETTLASDSNRPEDPVRASLSQPVIVQGAIAIPSGSVLLGHVTLARESEKVKGRAQLGLRFDRVRVGPVTYDIRTDPLYYVAKATKKDDAAKIGIGAAAGAVVGAIAGGKKGAAIGSVVGGGGGTAVVLATAGDEIRLTSGRRLRVELTDPLTIRLK